MKRTTFLMALLLTSLSLSAQIFSFPMYFEDAMGNKDTITIGYDPMATDSVDASFGETNIISTPINGLLDVRITNEYNNREFSQVGPGTYHIKTQILKEACNSWASILVMDIHTDHWPVTATWDSTPFQDPCRYFSVFTAINPGGWWDVGSRSDLQRVNMRAQDSVTFTSNHDGSFFNPAYSYLNDSLDTIPVFWMSFSAVIGTSLEEALSPGAVSVYPNPSSDFLRIAFTEPGLQIESLQLFDLAGAVQEVVYDAERIDLRSLPEGIYFLRLQDQEGRVLTHKIQKY